MKGNKISILALGDSYTVGEGINVKDSWPYQLKDSLIEKGYRVKEPEVIAKTGWTTGELLEAIREKNLQSTYDLVFLLAGVNNQYRGDAVKDYREEFRKLLSISLNYSGNCPSRVIVISIPDWGHTPFAQGKDLKRISQEIDEFNQVAEEEARLAGIAYVQITDLTRVDPMESSLIAEDGLHPSGKMYALWIPQILKVVLPAFK